jgi:hypothetical protein
MTPERIGKALRRNTNYVKAIIKRGEKHAKPTATQHHIPIAALAHGAAGTTITAYLASRGLSDKEIAALMHKDTSTVWSWRTRGGNL